MLRVSEIDFSRNIEAFQELALGEPVVLTHEGRDKTVVISVEEYERLQRNVREVVAAGDLPDSWLAAVEAAEMDPRHEHLNRLLDD